MHEVRSSDKETLDLYKCSSVSYIECINEINMQKLIRFVAARETHLWDTIRSGIRSGERGNCSPVVSDQTVKA